MADLSKEEKAEKCFQLVEELKKATVSTMAGYLITGKVLAQISEEKLYSYYGSHITKFDDFLKELRISHSTGYNCMAIYRKFYNGILKRKLEIEYFRLVRLLPVADRLTDTEEWLQKAQDLPSQDFDNEIRMLRGGVNSNSCYHTGDVVFYVKCKVCGKFIKQSQQEVEDRLNLLKQNAIQNQQGQGGIL